MALVLEVLDNIAVAARSGEDPDFELVEEIMHYMTVYPDAVHHPKEDLLYGELIKRTPEFTTELASIPREHHEIALLGRQLRDDAAASLAGAAVRRKNFLDDTSSYVQLLRKHMQWEEEDLFKRVDDTLGENAIPTNIEDYQNIRDPLLELEVESGFRRMISNLKDRRADFAAMRQRK